MSFTTGAALLDAVVLAVVSREGEGTYGYKITQEIKQALELSESTLYPVLRRLQRDGCLTIYDEPFNGRNRRYYKITRSKRRTGADVQNVLISHTLVPGHGAVYTTFAQKAKKRFNTTNFAYCTRMWYNNQ